MTGRWTDAFANGCLVAGEPPRCGAAEFLLPEEFLIRIPPNNLEAGLRSIAGSLGHRPTPDAIRSFAMRRLDWRHRIAVVFSQAGMESPSLTSELSELEELARAEGADAK